MHSHQRLRSQIERTSWSLVRLKFCSSGCVSRAKASRSDMACISNVSAGSGHRQSSQICPIKLAMSAEVSLKLAAKRYLGSPSRTFTAMFLFAHWLKTYSLLQTVLRTALLKYQQLLSAQRTVNFAFIALFNSIQATPLRFCGCLSLVSRTCFGKHKENAAKTDLLPLNDTWTTVLVGRELEADSATTILLKASARLKLCSDAFGLTIPGLILGREMC